jgi:O-antigen/teichoic acid export membrane protein
MVQAPLLAAYAVLVPRLMGPGTYGEFALLLSLVAIALSLTDLGLTEVCGRFVPELRRQGPDAVRRLGGGLFAVQAALGLVAAALFVPLAHAAYGDRFPVRVLALAAGVLVVGSLGSVPLALTFGLGRVARHAARDPLRRALTLTLILLLFPPWGLAGAVAAVFATEALLAGLYAVWTRRHLSLERLASSRTFLRPYLRFGLLFFLSWGLLNVWLRLGNPLVEHFRGDAREVAVFDIPAQMFSIAGGFTLAVASALIPALSELRLDGDPEEAGRRTADALRWGGVFCATAFWVFTITAGELVPALLGPGFERVAPNGSVLLLGLPFLLVAQMGFAFSVVDGRPSRYLTSLAAAVVALLAAASWAVPRWGGLGCAAAYAASSGVLAGVMTAAFRRELLPRLRGPALALAWSLPAAPLAFVDGGRGGALLRGAAFLIGYPLLLLALRLVHLRELRTAWGTLVARRRREPR